jgi:hypothetical protein
MSKLSKAQAKLHQQACDLIASDRTLTFDEKWFVLGNWQESANHVNSVAGAFFTPPELASDFDIDVCGKRIIDLCAGIGTLSFMAMRKVYQSDPVPEIVCVELNPDYITVGRKIVPDATWIQASVFELPDLGKFDCAISNPPFGSVKRNGRGGARYTGNTFEYHVIDVAETIAHRGVFIIPQQSAPFRYSGQNFHRLEETDAHKKFREQTGIHLVAGCGVDTSIYLDQWHGVSPMVEIAIFDKELEFDVKTDELKAAPVEAQDRQDDLFSREVAA